MNTDDYVMGVDLQGEGQDYTVWVCIRFEPSENGKGLALTVARGTVQECVAARDRDKPAHPAAMYRMRPSRSSR